MDTTASSQEQQQQQDVSSLYEVIREHSATVLGPKGNKVFYNKVQNVNRDLSVLVLNVFAEQVRIESETRIKKRRAHIPGWRNPQPTWTTWGDEDLSATASNAATASSSETADNEESTANEETSTGNDKKRKREDEEGNNNTNNDDQHQIQSDSGLVILEALAASGLRSIRYAKEIRDGLGVDFIVTNDLESHAVEAIKRNVVYNGLDGLGKVLPSCADASDLMHRNAFLPDRIRVAMSNNSTATTMSSSSSSTTTPTLDTNKASLPLEVRLPKGHGFDAIDLDPYGSPAKFIDSAVRAIRDGGLLCVTATDMAAVIGTDTGSCYPRYGVQSVRGDYDHEFAIRTLLSLIERRAIVYDRHIVPLLSVHLDFYVRVFVRVYTSKNEARNSPSRLGYVYQAKSGSSYHVVPVAEFNNKGKLVAPRLDPSIGSMCAESKSHWEIGGPIWAAPMHNPAFVQACIDRFGKGFNSREAKKKSKDLLFAEEESTTTIAADDQFTTFDPTRLPFADRVYGTLVAISDELHDVPLHYDTSSLSKFLHCSSPPMENLFAALVNLGYRVSQVHYNPNACKTDAPPNVVWDIMRGWIKKNPIHPSRLEGNEILKQFVSVEPSVQVNFQPSSALRAKLRGRKEIPKYMPNPEPNWGPKARAEGTAPQQTHKRKRGR